MANKFSETVAQIQTRFCRTFSNHSKDLMRWVSRRITCKAKPEQRLKQHVRPSSDFCPCFKPSKREQFFYNEQRWAGLFHLWLLHFTPTHTHTYAERQIQNKHVKREKEDDLWIMLANCKAFKSFWAASFLEVVLYIHNCFALWSIECSFNGLKGIYFVLLICSMGSCSITERLSLVALCR